MIHSHRKMLVDDDSIAAGYLHHHSQLGTQRPSHLLRHELIVEPLDPRPNPHDTDVDNLRLALAIKRCKNDPIMIVVPRLSEQSKLHISLFLKLKHEITIVAHRPLRGDTPMESPHMPKLIENCPWIHLKFTKQTTDIPPPTDSPSSLLQID